MTTHSIPALSDPLPTPRPSAERHRDKRGNRLPRGLFWCAPGVYGVRFVCGVGHDHKEPVGALKEDAVRVHHARRARVLAEPGWCPRVERLAAKVRSQADEARERARITFGEYAEGYLKWSETNKRSWTTDRAMLKSRLTPTFGTRKLDEVTTSDVERFRETLADKIAPATANRYMALVSGMFRRAIKLGHVTANPVKGVSRYKEAGRRIAWLNAEEESAILDALPAHLRPLFTVSVHTGLRWSEQAGLRWADVDMLAGIITVRRSKNGHARRIPTNSLVRSKLVDLASGRRQPNNAQEPVFPCPH